MDKIFQAVMRQSVKVVLNSNGSGFSERRDVYIFKGMSRKKGGGELSVIGVRSALPPSGQRKFRIVIPSFFKRGGIVYKKNRFCLVEIEKVCIFASKNQRSVT